MRERFESFGPQFKFRELIFEVPDDRGYARLTCLRASSCSRLPFFFFFLHYKDLAFDFKIKSLPSRMDPPNVHTKCTHQAKQHTVAVCVLCVAIATSHLVPLLGGGRPPPGPTP